jgi:hypothetical protein
MENDRTFLTDNYLVEVMECIEDHGLDVEDFEFSTPRSHGYKGGRLDPKAVVHVHRISTKIEKNYPLGEEDNFSSAFCNDLMSGVFDRE